MVDGLFLNFLFFEFSLILRVIIMQLVSIIDIRQYKLVTVHEQ